MKHRKSKHLTPRKATEKKMEPIAEQSFKDLLNRAIKTPSEKPAAK